MHFRNPKKLNSIIKIVLMAMCLGYLIYKLSLADFQNLFAQLIDLRANKKNWISIIAVVVLILVLAFLGWTMSKQKETDNFPKLQTSCPDFWKIEKDGEKNYCIQPEQDKVNSGSADAINDAPETPEILRRRVVLMNYTWKWRKRSLWEK